MQRMKRLAAIFTIFFCISLLLAGCWNRRELNEVAITVALGIDKSEGKYAVSAQVVNPSEVAARKGEGGKGAPVVTFLEKGDTIHEALRRMTTDSPRKIYLSHIRMIVFGEELAREGIGKTLDFLSRDHEMRTDYYISIAKGMTAEKILSEYTIPQEIIPANHMYKSLETSDEAWAATAKISLDDLISDIIKEGKQPVITGIVIMGAKNEEEVQTKENVESIRPISNLHFPGMAVFKSDKLIDWLSEDESKGYNYTQGNVKSTVVEVACPGGGKIGVELIRTKEKLEAEMENGKPAATIDLRVEGNVSDVECASIDVSKEESIYELEKKVEQRIQAVIEDVVYKAQHNYKADIFGFGEALYRSDPNAWKKLKDNWEREFINLSLNVKVDAKIRRIGTISKSFQDKLKG